MKQLTILSSLKFATNNWKKIIAKEKVQLYFVATLPETFGIHLLVKATTLNSCKMQEQITVILQQKELDP